MRKSVLTHRDDVFLIDEFLSTEECAAFIGISEGQGYEGASITTGRGVIVAKDVRNNDRLFWEDALLARRWWERASEFFPSRLGTWQAIGLNERFRFYRYRVGQKFAQHRDGSFQRSDEEMSWMTLLVYLNSDFTGGRTRFDLPGEPELVSVSPLAGRALVFAHQHMHEGEEVLAGVKYVLRTDVMYRKLDGLA